MEETEEPLPMEAADPEMRELLGFFDAPAFARRARDVEYSLARLRTRCQQHRRTLLEMVRMRLRQWARSVQGPGAWQAVFAEPIDGLWPLAEAAPPVWASQAASLRGQRAAAKALVASVERFNRRWLRFVDDLAFAFFNHLIDQYNRYYVFEKECCVGSARIAAQHFEPKLPISAEWILADFPPLPTPVLLT